MIMQTVVTVPGSVRSVRVASASRPGVVHQVVLTCTCEGFQFGGYCRHLGEASEVLKDDTRAQRLRTRYRLGSL